MATGRTINKYSRVYIDGYDMSCDTRSIGPLDCTFAEGVDDPLCDALTGVWLGQASISPGTLNGIFDNTTDTGILTVLGTSGTDRDVMVAQGIRAIPAVGDPVFCGQFMQDDFIVGPEGIPSTVTIKFGQAKSGATAINYAVPWGTLLHENSAETSSNTDTGGESASETTKGGWMMYQVLAGDGTASIIVEDSSTLVDGNFAQLLTSGVVDFTNPISGVVALANTATVKAYTRWQLTLGTANTVTFALAFMRGR